MDKNLNKVNNIENKINENNIKIIEYQKLIQELENENLKLEKRINKKKIDFDLNEKQLEAVKGFRSNSIIIACPGSGKTHTLISKVINLVKNKNINPQKIIMITFTKKASMEMNERLKSKLGFSNLKHVGTLHGLAYRTLQKYDKINYTILDDTDTNKSLQNQMNLLLNNEYNKIYKDDEKTLLIKKIIVIYNIISCQYPQNLDNVLQKLKLKEYKVLISKCFTPIHFA